MIELEPGSREHVAQLEEPPHSLFGKVLLRLSEVFALLGGVTLIALIAMSIVSIVGRKLFEFVVPGDVEMIQMGTAGAVAAFLPYCQINDEHVRVDFFTAKLSGRGRAFLDCVASLLLCASAALIAWRTLVAAQTSYESAETSLMLSWPIWCAIAAMVPSFVLLAFTGFYIARRRFHTWMAPAGTIVRSGIQPVRHSESTMHLVREARS
ncbi:MAG TPA: TRAP transporter small permease [Noviherbaspirillum sp.]|uniref:TRAP transporter small permease n=1 Tax=Noviherbaspirillum sp. TaxID=1926288 RepID=UPI002B47573B|nr:TRAP transporter small permease [Noviherbaspirillum sp.]HJV85408.1 TRAP transporter small permease [Noviherbaspirillum sp.]